MSMRLLFTLIWNLLMVVAWPWHALRQRRAVPQGGWLTLEIDGALTELRRPAAFWDRRSRGLALHTMRRALRVACADPRVAGVVVTLKQVRGGSASALGLRSILERVREANKRVVVLLPHGAGSREMLVASAADRVLAGPGTEIAAMGFAVEAPYVRDALDRFGLDAEVLARGRYKTAGEALVATSMSDAQREQLGALLDTTWDVLVGALSTGRGVDEAVARAWIDDGPWMADEAIKQGLIDAEVYEDELPVELDPSRSEGAQLVKLDAYWSRMRRRWQPWRASKRIAVVEVHGPIVSKQTSPWMRVAVDDQVCRMLDAARKNTKVAGVIVHIDSRGGGAVASDRMLHATRRLADEKPVVACMADAAASGGYMVAAGAHEIVAQPTTVTGSIGVVAARVVVRRLLDRVGIHTQVIKRGARADMLSPLRVLAEDERTAVERQLHAVYRRFLEAVAAGRRMPLDKVEELAAGRVWSGRDAAAWGLVDRLGGFGDALEAVRRRVGRGADEMQPMLMAPARPVRLPLPLASAASLALRALPPSVEALVTLAMHASGERAWLWCGVDETELGA